MGLLEDEIDRLKDENKAQHEQILILQSKLNDAEVKLAKVMFLWNKKVKIYLNLFFNTVSP